jgi:hypothetical protein
LTLVLFLEETTIKKKIFFSLQIVVVSRFILQAHSMEFLYYLMYMLVFSILYIDKIYIFIRRYFYFLLPILGGMAYFVKNYQPEHSKIFDYLSMEKLPLLYEKIMQEGSVLLSGYNRASGSVNELMAVSALVFIGFIGFLLWDKLKNSKTLMNIRMLIFIGITSLFVLIPLYQFSGGLFAVITNTMVVNRLYYSSSLFLLLPIALYYVVYTYKLKYFFVNLVLLGILTCTFIYSGHSDAFHHNYAKNIDSIKNSFNERKVGFNLSKEQIRWIGVKIKEYESQNITGKKIRYYARADMAFVIKYIYHKNVYWKGRRASLNYKKIYEQQKETHDYTHILLEAPLVFPSCRPFI